MFSGMSVATLIKLERRITEKSVFTHLSFSYYSFDSNIPSKCRKNF